MAYDAKVAFFDIGKAEFGRRNLQVPLSLSETMFPPAFDVGARIYSNSWGVVINAYTDYSRDIDRYSFQNQDFLVFVAAGNRGHQGIGSVISPATSKNCVSVGMSQNSIAAFRRAFRGASCPSGQPCENSLPLMSSVGPRFDGGICPLIIAPGDPITSSRSSVQPNTCGSVADSGTSMATPIAAASGALVRQYFMDGFYPTGSKRRQNRFVPMGALVKAILVNSAVPLSGTHGNTPLSGQVPDNFQGFGSIRLDQTLRFSNSNHNLQVVGDFSNMIALNEGDSPFTTNVVVHPSRDLKVTLAYHDYEGSAFATHVLVNDLDLTVECVSGCSAASRRLVHFPNGLNSSDSINNVEQIVIPAHLLTSGETYRISVTARSVPIGPQPFALVITGGFDPESRLPVAVFVGIMLMGLVGLYITIALLHGYCTKGRCELRSLCCLPVGVYRAFVPLCCPTQSNSTNAPDRAYLNAPTQAKARTSVFGPKYRPGSEWSCHTDQDGNRYWHNVLTKESTWIDPFSKTTNS
eukprot:c17110_g1_i1.p1 GENE.c17110_g1_i1~~c17110_g1_i1.p1  ORF type:complete len:522 (+),score=89.75 c17110_g1_i1:876-2441(+)